MRLSTVITSLSTCNMYSRPTWILYVYTTKIGYLATFPVQGNHPAQIPDGWFLNFSVLFCLFFCVLNVDRKKGLGWRGRDSCNVSNVTRMNLCAQAHSTNQHNTWNGRVSKQYVQSLDNGSDCRRNPFSFDKNTDVAACLTNLGNCEGWFSLQVGCLHRSATYLQYVQLILFCFKH